MTTWPELPADEKKRDAFLADRAKVEAAINSIDFAKLAAAADKYRAGNSNSHRATYMTIFGFTSEAGKGDHQTWSNPLLSAYAKFNDMHIPQNMWNIRTSEQPIGYESVDMGGKSGLRGSWGGTVSRNEWVLEAVQQKLSAPGKVLTSGALSLEEKKKILFDHGFVPLEQRGGTSQVWMNPAMQEHMKQLGVTSADIKQPAEHGKHGEAFTIMLSTDPNRDNWQQVAERMQWCREKCAQLDRAVKVTSHFREMMDEICLISKERSWKREVVQQAKKDPNMPQSAVATLREKFSKAQAYKTVLQGAVQSLKQSRTELIRQITR